MKYKILRGLKLLISLEPLKKNKKKKISFLFFERDRWNHHHHLFYLLFFFRVLQKKNWAPLSPAGEATVLCTSHLHFPYLYFYALCLSSNKRKSLLTRERNGRGGDEFRPALGCSPARFRRVRK